MCGVPAQAQPDNTALLANACATCHGPLGVSAGPSIPNLAGQTQGYFVAAMQRFKTDELPSTIMGRLAKGYSDAEIEAMGTYFAQLPAIPKQGAIDKAQRKRGSKIFFKHCRTCHLDGQLWKNFHQYRRYDQNCSKSCHEVYGAEPGEEIPSLGGQWPDYLKMQLADFKSGRRAMSDKKAKSINALSPEDMEDVAYFYAMLKDLKRE